MFVGEVVAFAAVGHQIEEQVGVAVVDVFPFAAAVSF
jgi:hypothetical protein